MVINIDDDLPITITIDNFQDTIIKKGGKPKPKPYTKPVKGYSAILLNKKLYYGKDGEIVYGEPKVRKYRLNGQSIYNRTWSWQVRCMVVEYYHSYFTTIIKEQIKKRNLSNLFVSFILEYPKNSKVPDIDNMWLLVKVFNDSLTLSGIIKDDNPKYIYGFSMEYRELDNKVLDNRLIIELKQN